MHLTLILLHLLAFAFEVLQTYIDVVLLDNIVQALRHLLLYLLQIFSLLLVAPVAELNDFCAVGVLPTPFVVLSEEIDKKEGVPELDEPVSRVGFVFLVERQFGSLVGL